MNKSLVEKLLPITAEEERVLESGEIDPTVYTENADFVVDGRKLLSASKLIEIRRHTRFVHFPKHRHNYIEVVYMCRGETTHIVNDESIQLKEGDLLFLSQRATHEILPARKEDIAINFIILPEFFEQMYAMLEEEKSPLSDFIIGCLFQRHSNYNYLYFNVAGVLPIQNLVEILVYYVSEEDADQGLLPIKQRTMSLLLVQLMHFADKMRTSQDGASQDSLAVAVLKYVDAKYKDATLTEFAAMQNYDMAWVSKEIKRQIGKTFKELLHEKRMSLATYLLVHTKISISELMEIIGYENSSFFHKKFKGRYGMSPKEYRQSSEKREKR